MNLVLDVLSGIWFWELVCVCVVYLSLNVLPVQEMNVLSVLVRDGARACGRL